jgi:uncharacterized cupredoxin-like copper-binding protein
MKKAVCLLVLMLSATMFVACGGDDEESGDSEDPTTFCPSGDETEASSGEELVVSADPTGKPTWKPTSLSADAGEITIELRNPSDRCHDIAVKAPDGEILGNTQRVKRGESNVVLEVESGQHDFYSTVPGDRAAGLQGTLTVK